ncbi:MAG: DUF721 domain-containing protein [Candidatus Tectomicrobia bacterium]|nr:DUF721 domain-containing protein [Candidatus Tectomicrobia bacterium]
MESVKEVLERLFSKRGLEAGMRKYKAFLLWDQVVGKQIALISRPQKIRAKTFIVTIAEPVWVNHLQLYEETIRKRLNEMIGENVIEKVRFTFGEVKGKENFTEEEEESLSPSREFSPEEWGELEEELQTIHDRELRESLKSVMRRLCFRATE